MNFYLEKGGKVKVLHVFKGTEKVKGASKLYDFLKEREIFKGDTGEVYSDLSPSGDNIVLLGLGDKNKITSNILREAFFNLGKELMKFKVKDIEVSIPVLENLPYNNTLQAIIEGLMQSEYNFEKYLTEKKTIPCIENVYLDISEDKKDESLDIINETKNLIKCVFSTRDIVNEPAMNITPEVLANTAKNELEDLGVKVEVYDKEKIEELGMNAFLAVAKGSSQEPRFIVMNYQGNPKCDEKIALIGKGLTYDSGGYSIKSAKGMSTMFSDMAGAASVIYAIKAIAKAKIKKNVVGIVAACENLISGSSYKPGDIITSMSGKTIEVLNTDAEGRLTLADALWYATDKVKADAIVDVATLTGACEVALGNIYTGAITNDKSIMKEIEKAAKIAGEPVWELPNDKDYKELIKGTFADIKNSSQGGAGAITAALFLEEFVNETPWVHLDVAGTAYISSKRSYLPKGATGVPVKTLYYFVKDLV